ncbi:MAG TPA: DUF6603 domain-containing protein [Polyangia bacterium]|nr:DUF6603 domain-containing protein [Polyangia bacterium]
MSWRPPVPASVLDAARAIGLVDASGEIDAQWFQDPLTRVKATLSGPAQREAFRRFLGAVAPPAKTVDGVDWHPLAGDQIFLTLAPTADGIDVGLAAEVGGAAQLRATLLVAHVTATDVSLPPAPFTIELDVPVGWTRPAHTIALAGVRVAARVGLQDHQLTLLLQGLDLDGTGPHDRALDPTAAAADGSEAQVLIALLAEELAATAGAAAHLAPVLGLGDGVPPLPLPAIAGDPTAWRRWLAALVATGVATPPGPSVLRWLGHLASLAGSSAPDASGTGTSDDPWRARLAALDGGAGLDLTVALQETAPGARRVLFGVDVALAPAAAPVDVRFAVALAAVPLDGLAAAAALPSARLALRATFPAGTPVRTLAGGLAWAPSTTPGAGRLSPFLELEDVNVAGVHYDHLSLSDAGSVTEAAAAAVASALAQLVGPHLGALLGLRAPADDPAWPHLVKAKDLVSRPLDAIGAVHRAALLDSTHGWSHLFAELVALASPGASTSGSGTAEDPWRLVVGATGDLELALAAWTEGDQTLRLGLLARAPGAAAASLWEVSARVALLAIALPADATPHLSLLGGLQLEALLHPTAVEAPDPDEAADGGLALTVAASGAGLSFAWAPGAAASGGAFIRDLAVTVGGAPAIALPMLRLPLPGDFSAAALGIAPEALDRLLVALAARAVGAWGGATAQALAGLVGVSVPPIGLPATDVLPTLADTGASLLADPAAAARGWLARLAADAAPLIPRVLAGLPGGTDALGGGVRDDPWSVAVVPGLELLAWLSPGGSPDRLAAVRARLAAAADYSALISAATDLGPFVPGLAAALAERPPGALASALLALGSHFTNGDGVVALPAQTGTGFTTGTVVTAAHPALPGAADAVAQVLAQLDAWAAGGQRVVLLVSAPFADRSSWSALLAAAGASPAAPHFDLRGQGDAALAGVDTTAAYYIADLGFQEGADPAGQLGRLLARLAELAPGVPVSIVAHSASGLAALAAATAAPARVRGLITLAAPIGGAPLEPLRDPALADGLRFLERLGPTALGTGPLAAAADLLFEALDGWRAGAADTPAVAAPFSLAAFMPPAIDSSGGGPSPPPVPALAITARLGEELFAVLKQGLEALAQAAAATAPTHLQLGTRLALTADPSVDLRVRADLARIALVANAPAPVDPPWRIEARAVLRGADGGWLAGSPAATLASSDARVRWAEIGFELAPGALSPIARLHDAGWRAPLDATIALPGPAARALLGAAATSPAGDTLGARRRLLQALAVLGLATTDETGGLALAADGLDALAADAAGFLGPRLGAALKDDALWKALGAVQPGGGAMSVGPLALSVVPAGASGPPWRLVVETAGDGLALGDGAVLRARAKLGGPAPEIDARLDVAAFSLQWSNATSRLTAAVDGWMEPVTLLPAAPGALAAAVTAIAPRLLVSAGLAALLDRELPEGLRLGPLDGLLSAPGRTLAGTGALGGAAAGGGTAGGIDGSRLGAIAGILAGLAKVPQDAAGALALPAGLSLSVGGGPGLVDITLASTRAAGPLGVQVTAHARLDAALHVAVDGRVALAVPLPGSNAPLGITIAAAETGFSVDVLLPGATSPIHVFPFGGLGSLLGGAETLLPNALDALVAALGPANPPAGVLGAVLDVATAAGLWDAAGHFAAHAVALRALSEQGLDAIAPTRRAAVAASVANLLTSSGLAVPGAFTADGTHVRWAYDLPAAVGGTATLDLDVATPAVSLRLTGLAPAGGLLRAGLTAGAGADGVDLALELGLALDSLGLPAPTLQLGTGSQAGGAALSVELLPFGVGTQDTLAISLAPSLAVHAGTAGLGALVTGWALPLAARRLLDEAQPHLTQPLWTGGPSLGQALTGAGILSGGALASPLPGPEAMARGLVAALGTAPVPLTPTLGLRTLSTGGRVGLLLSGHQDFDLGGHKATFIVGEPSLFVTDSDRGLGVMLFTDGGGTPSLSPELRLIGCGLGLAGADGAPLVDAGPVRLGAVRAYLFGTFGLGGGGFTTGGLGAGLELDDVGLPVAQAASGGSNPVVAGLLGAAGGATPGDAQPVAPEVSVAIWDRGAGVQLTLDGKGGPVWLPVARAFGPIFVDQVGVAPSTGPAPGLELLIDGSVSLGGLLVQLDDLALTIPFASVAKPHDWTVDLAGLGVSFSAASVVVSGALRRGPGPTPEYDGFLLAKVGGRSFSVVGSFAEPTDAGGSYPSLFLFAAVPVPLGGPPMCFVTGLGAGGGYNRAVVPPAQVTDVESFVLVEAIDDASLAADPAAALARMATSIPPRRGSAFLAAGARFTSYAFVHSTVVATVDIDRGVEVNVLGVSRMQLPPRGTPLANVELALHARYSSAENMLSVIAQLTDASWIIDKDCQLTGGFALAIWFDDWDAVLTLGGYHPDFVKPARYPDVPRLGFNWRVSDSIVIKGESYFALTSSCVMAGGRLEASYDGGSFRAWFTTHTDILVSWEPTRYDFEVGVSIGASYTLEVCFIKCVHVSFSVSIGADLRLRGPALHGTVTVDLAVATVTFDFGSESQRPDYLPGWSEFAAKYLSGGEPVAVRVERGLLAARTAGAAPDGTPGRPFLLAGELALVTETRMPADRFSIGGGAAVGAPGAATLDLAPLGPDATAIPSTHALTLEVYDGVQWTEAPIGDARTPVSPVMGAVPEGTFRFRADDDDTPAARTLPAVVGLRLDGHALPEGARPPFPLVDLIAATQRSRPLPFEAPGPDRQALLDQLGTAASALVTLAAAAPTATVNAAARQLLSGAPAAVAARAGTGLPPAGVPGVGLASVARRSAPPTIAPLATGLARREPGLGTPPPRPAPPAPAPVLDAPRLRAALGATPAPTKDAAPWRATRVSAALAAGAARVAPPVPAAAVMARLARVAAAQAPQPTRAAITGRSWQTGELGAAVSAAARATARQLEADVTGAGVTLPSGATHVWDVPPGPLVVAASGSGALRLVFLGPAGAVLADQELVPGAGARVQAPAGTQAVAASCLGVAPLASVAPAQGAVTARTAPPGGVVATGWELSDRAVAVGPSTILARGATLALGRSRPAGTRAAAPGTRLVALADRLVGPAAVQTTLPAGTPVVLVLLDQLDPTAAEGGDLRIAATGATLSGPVARASAGKRRALLYEATAAPDGSAATAAVVVSVASASGFAAAGVIGLGGRAADWTARLGAGIPDGLVPDDPLTPEGDVTLRLIASGGPA